jgi:hypothetical protein
MSAALALRSSGTLASSQVRNSMRNASCSGVKSKSMPISVCRTHVRQSRFKQAAAHVKSVLP